MITLVGIGSYQTRAVDCGHLWSGLVLSMQEGMQARFVLALVRHMLPISPGF